MGEIKQIVAFAVAFLVGSLWMASSYGQEDLPADEMVRKSQQAFFYAGDDMKAKVLMRLISKGGKERIREMTMLRKDTQEGGDQKYFMHFSKPADVRNMTFMVQKYPQKDDDRWLYIPAIKMVRRIAANDKRSSFVGSDFTYEDLSGRDIEEDDHTLLQKEETLGGKACFVIESVPKSSGGAEWSRKISYIDKASFIPLKEEYYDPRGELLRTFTADEIKEVQGFPTIVKRTMQNVSSGHRTEVTFGAVQYNLGLPETLFSERSLRNVPMRWIR